MSANFYLSLRRPRFFALISALTLITTASAALAQQAPPPPRDYYVGSPGIGLPVAPPAPGAPPVAFAPASKNVHMFGALYSVESCVYDPARGVIVAPSRGVGQSVRANDAWISMIHQDRSEYRTCGIGIRTSERDCHTVT